MCKPSIPRAGLKSGLDVLNPPAVLNPKTADANSTHTLKFQNPLLNLNHHSGGCVTQLAEAVANFSF